MDTRRAIGVGVAALLAIGALGGLASDVVATPASASPSLTEVPPPNGTCWHNGVALTGSEYQRAAAALSGDPIVSGTVGGQPYTAHISQLVAAGTAGHPVWPDGGGWTWICAG